MSFAKVLWDHSITKGIKAKLNFHRIWIVLKKIVNEMDLYCYDQFFGLWYPTPAECSGKYWFISFGALWTNLIDDYTFMN